MCSIELHNENCFDFLPKIESKTVDLILIDPPYLISRNTNLGNLEETVKMYETTGKDTIIINKIATIATQISTAIIKSPPRKSFFFIIQKINIKCKKIFLFYHF